MATGSSYQEFAYSKCSLSLDISTSNVGIALWNEVGKLIEVRHLVLKTPKQIPEENRYLYKAKLLKQYFEEYVVKIEEDYQARVVNIFIEAPLSDTPVNINTTAKLLAFNGIACYIINEIFNIEPFLITIYQARKLFCTELIKKVKRKGEMVDVLSFPKGVDKKDYIWQKVSKLEPQIKWIYKVDKHKKITDKIHQKSYDISDAYAVGIAGLKVLGILK
jgi:hypothetical protein